MKTIWKYPVPLPSIANAAGGGAIDIPVLAYLLHVGRDADGAACMWWQVDDEQTRTRKRRFEWVGTGNPVPDGDFRGTVVDAPFVWHLYEVHS